MDDEDTLVVPSSKKKEVRLQPMNAALTEDLILDLSQPARIGRTAGNPTHANFIGVSNKVVSRNHVDFWEADGKVYIRDVGSAAGTYLNGTRLSPPSSQSSPVEVVPDSILQLGTNYTEDEHQLNQDPSLRCIIVKVKFRPLVRMAPMAMSLAVSPHLTPSDVDLNNLTHVVLQAQKNAKSPLSAEYSNSPSSSHGFQRSNSKDDSLDLLEAKKNATADMYQFELLRKKELEEKLKDMHLKTSSNLSFVADAKDQFFVTILRQAYKISKIQVQAGGKDAFTISPKAWDSHKKFLLQDNRLQFSKTPQLEVIMDPTVKTGFKYHVVSHNGGSMLATIEKIDARSGTIEVAADSTLYKVQGDLSESYQVLSQQKLIADIVNTENMRQTTKGNLTRSLNVMIDKDQQHQIVIAAVIIFGLISP